jgi:hypothetical protein
MHHNSLPPPHYPLPPRCTFAAVSPARPAVTTASRCHRLISRICSCGTCPHARCRQPHSRPPTRSSRCDAGQLPPSALPAPLPLRRRLPSLRPARLDPSALAPTCLPIHSFPLPPSVPAGSTPLHPSSVTSDWFSDLKPGVRPSLIFTQAPHPIPPARPSLPALRSVSQFGTPPAPVPRSRSPPAPMDPSSASKGDTLAPSAESCTPSCRPSAPSAGELLVAHNRAIPILPFTRPAPCLRLGLLVKHPRRPAVAVCRCRRML